MNISFTSRSAAEVPKQVNIVLASQSAGRKMLLEKLGVRFRVAVSKIDEEAIIASDPLSTIKKRAIAKANELVKSPRVYGIPEEGKTLIIAADSMAILGKKSHGKALDREHARKILKDLMGKSHHFVTAVIIVLLENHKEVKRWEKSVRTRVTFRKLSAPELEAYVNRYDFTRFAAAYALNETPWDLVTKIEGSYTNVIGLPFEVILPVLRKLEVIKVPTAI